MTLIKSEQHSDANLSTSPAPQSKRAYWESPDGDGDDVKHKSGAKDSRPALVNKPLNIVSPKRMIQLNLKKPKLEGYMLGVSKELESPVKQHHPDVSFSNGPKIKSEFELTDLSPQETADTPISLLKKGDLTQDSPSVDPSVNCIPNGTKKKKLKSTDKFKKIVSSFELLNNPENDLTSLNSQNYSLERPGEYAPITHPLYQLQTADADNQANNDLFEDIEQDTERKFCQKTSAFSLSQWIDEGQKLMNSQTNLVSELVRERIELSNKFRVITTIINERAEALNAQGGILDDKLSKIKNLGNEILNII